MFLKDTIQIIHIKLLVLIFLIPRGGGKGPMKPRQQVRFNTVPIPSGELPER